MVCVRADAMRRWMARVLQLSCFYIVYSTFWVSCEWCFSAGKQQPLSLIRERGGQGMQTLAVRNITLTKDSRVLLSKITAAGKRRKWRQVQKLFSTYSGSDIPILAAVMHISLKCREYEAGRRVFERVCQENLDKNGPVFAAALKIHASLGESLRVQEIWEEAMATCEINAPLASARIDAAAVEGDFDSALEVLGLLHNTDTAIDIVHITSALRACRSAKGHRHESAKELLQRAFELNLKPNVVTFTSLLACFSEAPLREIQAGYAQMQELGIKPNKVFAETYVTVVLGRIPHGSSTVKSIQNDVLPSQPPARVQAAKKALEEFKVAGVQLTALTKVVDAALQTWKHKTPRA